MNRTKNFDIPIPSTSYKDIIPPLQQTVIAIDEALAKVAQGAGGESGEISKVLVEIKDELKAVNQQLDSLVNAIRAVASSAGRKRI